MYTIGIGPSSSHTVGPMLAMNHFAHRVSVDTEGAIVTTISIDLLGSLGATGRGHGTGAALVAGLAGESAATVLPDDLRGRFAPVDDEASITLLGKSSSSTRVTINYVDQVPPGPHSNVIDVEARTGDGALVDQARYASVGGGNVVMDGQQLGWKPSLSTPTFEIHTADELLAVCAKTEQSIYDVTIVNEAAWTDEESTMQRLDQIAAAMRACIASGVSTEGKLPGGLNVSRRALQLAKRAEAASVDEPEMARLDMVAAWAIAVNEQNAAGERVVTAPTNGAAGVMPAVLEYYRRYVPGADDAGVRRFLLTAAAIGNLIKRNASVSGADVGCQGEVGSACAMAAAALADATGGTPAQVENAAEIALEHHLGLTCDPVGGLVQIPCIERNAVAAVKAITTARLALGGDGSHTVSLDQVIETMRQTGADMDTRYKETSQAGLAVHVVEC